MKRVVVMLVVVAAAGTAPGQGPLDPETLPFLRAVDAGPLKRLAVEYNGRIAVLDTVAREQLSQMMGTPYLEEIEPVVAYLEIYFRAGAYLDRPLLQIREKAMREALTTHLTGADLARLQRTGRLPPGPLISADAGRYLLAIGRADREQILRATAGSELAEHLAGLMQQPENRLLVDRLASRYEAFLAVGVLCIIPRQEGGWRCLDDALGAGREADEQDRVYRELLRAWNARDAAAVNARVLTITTVLAARGQLAGPDGSPGRTVRELEVLYNRAYKGTVIWIGYAVALVALIVAAASGARWARRTGLVVFAISTGVFAAGFTVRWLISGRSWYLPPIMNQWEAVTGSALLGAVIALVLELRWRRNYVALAAALYATLALLAAHFVPIFFPGKMDAELAALPGLLSSKVMAVHVSVIIVGHALVGMTFFVSLIYLVGVVVSGRAESASADLCGPEPERTLAAIDRCNLLVAQLACWTVLTGTILGAYWGDIAWGRWWGWDRKETWALITAVLYLVILHVRFITPDRHRGWVTAVLCVIGFAVMMFNWIVVNFFLSGLHSYA